MNKELVAKLMEELESMPMEGNGSETDRDIQAFLDYLDTL